MLILLLLVPIAASGSLYGSILPSGQPLPNLPHKIMTLSYAPVLPGEPRSEGLSQAISTCERVSAAYELYLFGSNVIDSEMTWSDLSPIAREIATDNGLEAPESDLERLALADAADQWAREYHYGVDYGARWSMNSEIPTEPHNYEITISGGGPGCFIRGDFGLHGSVDSDSIEVVGIDTSGLHPVKPWDAYQEALGWFVQIVAC